MIHIKLRGFAIFIGDVQRASQVVDRQSTRSIAHGVEVLDTSMGMRGRPFHNRVRGLGQTKPVNDTNDNITLFDWLLDGAF